MATTIGVNLTVTDQDGMQHTGVTLIIENQERIFRAIDGQVINAERINEGQILVRPHQYALICKKYSKREA